MDDKVPSPYTGARHATLPLGATMKFTAILSLSSLVAACGSGGPETAQGPEQQRGQNQEQKSELAAEQAVIVHFDYGNADWAPFFELEKALEASIAAAGVGEYDGNELAADGSDGTLYMYGPNADKLFDVVKPHLASSKLLKNVEVTLRYGAASDLSSRESKVRLGT